MKGSELNDRCELLNLAVLAICIFDTDIAQQPSLSTKIAYFKLLNQIWG